MAGGQSVASLKIGKILLDTGDSVRFTAGPVSLLDNVRVVHVRCHSVIPSSDHVPCQTTQLGVLHGVIVYCVISETY